jgi:dTDP-4-dehydrorhamnose reductase
MKILVTGASGLLGANFILESRLKQIEIIAIDHIHRLHIPDAKVVQVDLTNASLVENIVYSYKPQWIINCASITDVDWCEKHPTDAWAIHVEASRYLASAARKVGARLAYISTDSVFDGIKGDYCEEDPCVPLNVYAITKLAGEKAALEDLPSSLIIRTNIYGWNTQNKQSLAEWMFNELVSQRPLFGFRDVIFTPILVNDLADLLFEMIDQGLEGVYHVAGALACSKYDFALQLADTFNLNKSLIQPSSINNSTLQAPRPKNTSLQTTKITHAINRSMPDVISGLKRFKLLQEAGSVSIIKSWQEVEKCQN